MPVHAVQYTATVGRQQGMPCTHCNPRLWSYFSTHNTIAYAIFDQCSPTGWLLVMNFSFCTSTLEIHEHVHVWRTKITAATGIQATN